MSLFVVVDVPGKFLGSVVRVKPHLVKPKSSVGAGDSMVGAMTAQIWKSKLVSKTGLEIDLLESKAEEIFRWGLAAAMATVVTPGTELGKKNQIESFLRKIKIQEVDFGVERHRTNFSMI
jgi:fructose-1-phosphate kinase PfkB-like protein